MLDEPTTAAPLKLRSIVVVVLVGAGLTWAACGMLGVFGLMQGVSQLGSLATGRDAVGEGGLGFLNVRVAMGLVIVGQLVGTAVVARGAVDEPRRGFRALLGLVGAFCCGPSLLMAADWLLS